jgi:hypothetical protein
MNPRWIVACATLLVTLTACNRDTGPDAPLSEDWGQHASMVLDARGKLHVAFYHRAHLLDEEREEAVGALVYATGQPSQDGTELRYTTVDGDVRKGLANVGEYASLAVSSSGHPHMAYYDKTNGDLKYATHDGSHWRVETVDATGDSGQYASLVLHKDQPQVAYYEANQGQLRYAWREGGQWRTAVVDGETPDTDRGRWAHLVVTPAGDPRIAYYDAVAQDLLLVQGSGPQFGAPTTVDAEGDVGRWPSVALSGGRILISYEDYSNHRLKVAEQSGGEWSIEIVDNSPWVGPDSALALDESGTPHVAYFDGYNNDLKYAVRTNQGWVTSSIDTQGATGYFNNLVVGSEGTRHFAYYSFDNRDLNVLVQP